MSHRYTLQPESLGRALALQVLHARAGFDVVAQPGVELHGQLRRLATHLGSVAEAATLHA